MADTWTNWSGGIEFRPSRVEHPASEGELVQLVQDARAHHTTIRAVGSSHSSSPLIETQDTLVSLDRMQGVLSADTDALRATVRAGSVIGQLGEDLLARGLSMENFGDIDEQAIAGAIGTGTHGTGHKLGNLSSQAEGIRLVTGTGDVIDCSRDENADVWRAARVGLGALGIMTQITLRVMPAVRLHKHESCVHIDECMERLDELIENNRTFDFYWYPRSEEAKLRELNKTDISPEEFEAGPDDTLGYPHEVIPSPQELVFHEMEYAVPADAGPECFQKVRERILKHHRVMVAWRVLYRTVAADDAFLSPMYERDTHTISLHQNQSLPYKEFFDDIEPIFRDYGGRAHWGKLHTQQPAELRELYPMWDRFQEIRKQLDPSGVFLNPYLRGLFEAA